MSFLVFALGAALGAVAVIVAWMADRQKLVRDVARLGAERDAARELVEAERGAAGRTADEIRDAFARLSKDALRESTTAFLQTADQTFRARQEAIEAVLTPVRSTLEKVQTQLTEVDRSREGSYRAVSQHLESLAQAQRELQSATDGLSRSLRSPNARGVWGEVQLRRVVELAGMLQYCDFIEKESATTDEGARQTPDLVVKLPGGTNIVIDAKVPIDAYLKASETNVEETRAAHLTQHTRQVRDHIRVLGSREYWKQFQPSPEMVVMFLPIEPLMAAAFERDGSLLDMAASLRVILASPMTLLAILRAVAYAWQQQAIAHNAEEIQQLGRDLYERLTKMVEHFEGIGAHLKQAADDYDKFIGSLEQKVVPAARRFKELGVSSAKELEAPSQLNLVVRRVKKNDFTNGSEAADSTDTEPTPLLFRKP